MLPAAEEERRGREEKGTKSKIKWRIRREMEKDKGGVERDGEIIGEER